jgi:type IV pilus assembly protein PilW
MRNGRISRASRGFTLVELMVGVMVGLIGTVVIFQVFAVSEAQKRTTTGSSDAQQNGVFSLFQMERDIRMAGYGLNYTPLLGCTVNGWYEPGGSAIQFTLVPVEIVNGLAGAPDQIRVAYGDSNLFMAPAHLNQTMGSANAPFKLRDRFGFNAGDLVIAAETGKPCTLAQATNIPSTLGQSDTVVTSSGNYTNSEGANVPAQYNKAGGLPAPNNIAYKVWDDASGTGGRLYNLGADPTVVTYAIQNNQLVVINRLTPGIAGQTQVIADGVVQLQAQYGYDGNSDGQVSSLAAVNNTLVPGTLDQWANTMPATATGADWAKVIAIRLVVTARSMTPERPNPASGACEATTVVPKWVTAGVDIDITIADPANWRCYRYRTFEVMVPLRNMVWFPTPA